VRWTWLVGGLGLHMVGCSDPGVQSGSRLIYSSTADSQAGRELIPAEWTVYEDTALSGDVTTASLQLPAAKDIEGLGKEDAPRLILRCMDGRVNAFIDPGAPDSSATPTDSLGLQTEAIEIRLDSAPACE
jgi:hypothetical protein